MLPQRTLWNFALATAAAFSSVSGSSVDLEFTVRSHAVMLNGILARMDAAHEESAIAIASLTARVASLEQSRRCDEEDTAGPLSGVAVNGGMRYLLTKDPETKTTKLSERGLDARVINVTDLYITGTLIWHGVEWSPPAPSPAPSSDPSPLPTLKPTPHPTPTPTPEPTVTWMSVSYQNSWTTYDSTFSPARFIRKNGVVHFDGLIKGGIVSGAANSIAFTLPGGYRPDYRMLVFTISASALGRIDIGTDGGVYMDMGSSSWMSLGSVSFPTGTSWTIPTYQNGWTSYDTTFSPARYMIESGIVHLDGLIKSGTVSGAANSIAFTLPVGYRPAYRQLVATVSYNGAYTIGRVDIGTDGGVYIDYGGNRWFSLARIAFASTAATGTWFMATYQNGWTSYDTTTFSPARYMMENGVVYLDGLIKSGTVSGAANGIAFMLPVGYRPAFRQLIPTIAHTGSIVVIGRVDVGTDGGVYMDQGGSAWFSLAGLSFATDS